MSNSNRLRNYTLGFLAGGLIAGAVGYVFWTDATYSEEQVRLQTEEHAAQYADTAYVAIECETTDVAASSEPQCIEAESEAAREAKRSEYDLEAQQLMATWTRVMGKAAIVGMGVGILGLFLIFVTFWETRKAARTSQKTYDAFIALERPRISLTLDDISTDGRGNFRLRVNATNIGKASSLVTNFLWDWQTTNSGDEVKVYSRPPKHELLEGGDTTEIEALEFHQDLLQESRFFAGTLVYRSALKEKHRTYFCFEVLPTSDAKFPDIVWRDYKGDDWPEDD